MKKILTNLLSVSAIILFSDAAFAENKNVVFTGASVGRGTSYYYFGGATALSGDIEKDGTLLRVGGGYGQYTYDTSGVVGGKVRGQVSSGDLMAGYQKNFSLGRAVLYVGGSHDNFDLNKPDNANRVAGGKFGAKTQLEVTLNLAKNVTARNVSNYSTAYQAYWSQTVLGYNFGKFTFGPEMAFLGNTSYTQQRIGANISNINVGLGELYLAAGYMKAAGMMGNDGGYGAIGFSSKF